MKCYVCHRNIKPGLESQKRIEEREGPVLYGEGQPGGPLDKATGPLLRAWHSKCFHAGRKRVRRGGDAVLGTSPELAALLDDWGEPDAPAEREQEEASESDRGNRATGADRQ